jgi:CheY-like chemotaxis protein
MKSICFVDDDRDELRRFRESLEGLFIIGTGVSLDAALDELRKRRVRKPDLFLLDLYYGPAMSDEIRGAIAVADQEILTRENEIRALLLRAGQSPDAGFQLAEEACARFRGTPRVFFSRKAFLQDALTAHERGLPVLEKPDPNEEDERSEDPYKAALRRHSDQLFRYLEGVINRNTWWRRSRNWLSGFASGFSFFLLKLAWDLWKSNSPIAATCILGLSLSAFAVTWFARQK